MATTRWPLKRGGAFELTSLPAKTAEHAADPERLERLGDAVERLAAVEPRLAQIIDLKSSCWRRTRGAIWRWNP